MKGFSQKWLEEQGLVEISPGKFARKPVTPILSKALGQSTPPDTIFNSSEQLSMADMGQTTDKPSKSRKTSKNGSYLKPVKTVTGYIEDHRLLEELFSSMSDLDIFIPVTSVSSKNSKEIGQIYVKGGKGAKKAILRKSDAALKYEEQVLPYLMINKMKFAAAIRELPKPYYLYFTFIMPKRMRWDYTNMVQLYLDICQKPEIGMLEDDDFSNVVPVFNKDVYLSKTRYGMLVQVIKGITIIK